MSMRYNKVYTQEKFYLAPNRWDFLALVFIFAIIGLLIWSASQMAAPYDVGTGLHISLNPSNLPFYALQTTFRMLIGLVISLLFTFIFGTWAAKSKQAEKIIIPLVDILQSVPILAFQAIAVVPFIMLFHGSMLGPECAAIFAVFTSQAWNMMLGFYQTVRNVPDNLKEAAQMYHLSAWQRFWRIEVPFSMPGLLWNTMMSMSASWFFVVATEAITVSGQNIRLPGIGSYIALAIGQKDMHAVGFAIITMLIVILLYDQILFRPLMQWAEKFKTEETDNEIESYSLVIDVLQRTRLLAFVRRGIIRFDDLFVNSIKSGARAQHKPIFSYQKYQRFFTWSWNIILIISVIFALSFLIFFVLHTVTWNEVAQVFLYGAYTATRVLVLIVLCSLIWVPVGVWIGRRPGMAQIAQPVVQFLAAFPANLLFPLVVIAIVTFHLNVEIWTTPLMILGAQWYILFNVIAGAAAIPNELYHAANNMNVKGWLWWRRVVLPGIFPYYITGAITAAGGAWNASIVAEVVSWGHTTLHATGLGAYIAEYTRTGDFHRIALGVGVMSIYVLTFNSILWRPLYNLAEKRFKI